MSDKSVIIVGGSSGIGRAAAKRFAEQDFTVFNMDIAKPCDEQQQIEFIPCDVAQPEQIKYAIEHITSKTKLIEAVIYSAGVHLSATVESTSEQDFARVININMAGCFYTLKYVLPHLRTQQRGAIVIVGSDQSFIGKRNSAVYGMTKAAIAQLAKSTALDYAPYGIRVNCVCPGTIDTPLYRNAITNYAQRSGISLTEIEAEEAVQQPVGRIGNPEEVAELIFFLADNDKSGFITGAMFPIDGGYTAA